MKKINKLLVLLLLVATLGLTACSKNVEGTLTEIMDKIYADVKEDEIPMLETVNI